MVAALAADQAEAPGFAARTVVRQCDLQCAVDRLGARVGEEHALEPLGRDRGEALGELERDRVAHLESRREIHLRRLALDRLHNLRPAVARVDAPQSRAGVENLAAFRRPVVHALGTSEQPRRLLELPVRRERHPERRLLEAGSELRALVHAASLPYASLAALH